MTEKKRSTPVLLTERAVRWLEDGLRQGHAESGFGVGTLKEKAE